MRISGKMYYFMIFPGVVLFVLDDLVSAYFSSLRGHIINWAIQAPGNMMMMVKSH